MTTSLGNPTHFLIGRCPECGHAMREYAGPFAAVYRRCPKHTGPVEVELRPIRGAVTDHVCDARCTAATSRVCNCSCGGRNHGVAHDWKAAADLGGVS